MKMIDVYGGLFTDIYIKGEEPHNKTINILPGGSGFNVAVGLSMLKNKIRFIGNIGNDNLTEIVLNKLTKYSVDINLIKINDLDSDIFISENEKPFAIKRNNNNLEIDLPEKFSDYAFVNSEINEKSLNKILKLDYKMIFIDTGPRHFLFKSFKKKENHFLITNSNKNFIMEKYDLLKMDSKGFKYKNIYFESNGKEFDFKYGTGDLLDVLIIDSFLRNNLNFNNLNEITKIIESTCEEQGAFNKIKTLNK
jgi:hypothetical protein